MAEARTTTDIRTWMGVESQVIEAAKKQNGNTNKTRKKAPDTNPTTKVKQQLTVLQFFAPPTSLQLVKQWTITRKISYMTEKLSLLQYMTFKRNRIMTGVYYLCAIFYIFCFTQNIVN